jgi:hypothetical protein
VIRDRRTLLAILLADIFVMAGAAFILWDRYTSSEAHLPDLAPTAPIRAEERKPSSPPPAAAGSAEAPFPGAAASPAASDAAAPASPAGRPRNVLFAYRDSKPSSVQIVGDFNQWKPQDLRRGANHTWTIGIKLAPGDYAYNYIVDGKVIRDPNQPRTAPEGRSLLTVKPLNE